MSEPAYPDDTLYVAYHQENDTPIGAENKAIGVYFPVWDNPMNAHQWAQTALAGTTRKYYVREVSILRGERRS